MTPDYAFQAGYAVSITVTRSPLLSGFSVSEPGSPVAYSRGFRGGDGGALRVILARGASGDSLVGMVTKREMGLMLAGIAVAGVAVGVVAAVPRLDRGSDWVLAIAAASLGLSLGLVPTAFWMAASSDETPTSIDEVVEQLATELENHVQRGTDDRTELAVLAQRGHEAIRQLYRRTEVMTDADRLAEERRISDAPELLRLRIAVSGLEARWSTGSVVDVSGGRLVGETVHGE